MPSLKWMAPQGRPRVFGIYKRVTSIGKAGANDVAIDSASLHPHHAQVVFDGRDFTIAPVDSGANLLVNGKRKKKSKIFHNDKLTLGEVDLVFSLYDESATRESGPSEAEVDTAEIEGMLKLSDFNRRLLEIRSIPEQIEALQGSHPLGFGQPIDVANAAAFLGSDEVSVYFRDPVSSERMRTNFHIVIVCP